MKIGISHETAAAAANAEKPSAVQTGRGAQGNAPIKAAPVQADADTGTQVALSSEATNLLASLADDGSFDVEKVNRISQAIAEGKFTINADAIADKLLDNAQEILGRAQPQH